MRDAVPNVQIEHVNLAAAPRSIEVSGQECLFVFWWGDYPVGQTYDVGESFRTVSPTALATNAVSAETLALAQQRTAWEATQKLGQGYGVSVVISTRDRPDDLARCLASFSEQTLVPGQIVVVDNASRDGRTKEVALAAGVSYVREDRPGLDFARNAGARMSSGEFVVYTDDDVRLHPAGSSEWWPPSTLPR